MLRSMHVHNAVEMDYAVIDVIHNVVLNPGPILRKCTIVVVTRMMRRLGLGSRLYTMSVIFPLVTICWCECVF